MAPPSLTPSAPGLLEVRELAVSYGAQQVLFGVNLSVSTGEVVALVGTNGAGKSTLLAAISGLTRPTAGTVHHRGAPLAGLGPAARVHRGIVHVPAGTAVFPGLSVLDNLLAACHRFAWDGPLVRARIGAALDLFSALAGRLDQRAGSLSGGEQQMLAIAKALVLRPDLLLVDELTLGLAPVLAQELLEVVRQLPARGTTVVMVEQSLHVARAVAGRAVWMDKGEVRFEGAPAELLERPDLVRAVFLPG